VAGISGAWLGRVGGRTLVELKFRWRKGQTLEPDWEVEMGYIIDVEGRPSLHARVDILPPPDFEATTMEEFMVLGMILTAVPAVNAIPAVVEAPPGIVTYTDLYRTLPRGYAAT
jgi:2,4-diaminopentanoate dehydrogenase